MKGESKAVLLLVTVLWCCCRWVLLGEAQKATVEVKVGVVLDLNLTVGRMGLSCINMSLSEFYASNPHYNTRLVLNLRDSKENVLSAASAAVDLIKNAQVQAIMGPISTMQTNFVVNLGQQAHVPIISFTATSPSLASLRSSYFFRIAQNDSAQVGAIGAIVQAFGWKEVVPIYADNEFGEGFIPFLTNALQKVDARVPYLSAIPPSASNDQISTELYKLMTMQSRVFIVHMSTDLGSRVFTIAKQIGMMSEEYVWIITNGMANMLNSLDGSVVDDAMQGVLGVETYFPRNKRLEDFKVRWKRKFLQDNPTMVDANLDIFGLWAYDATTALAMAIEKVGNANFGFQISNASTNLTDLDSLGVSKNGEKLRDALSKTGFKGLSGNFSVTDGKLQATAFQIVNVNGNGKRGVGFWTPENGLMRNLDQSSTHGTKYSARRRNLGPIIWPGESYSIPKGWQIPTKGNKLRIGVPVKQGFFEFVKIEHDNNTNTTKVSGYSIDVFDAAVKALPYALPYDLIPFAKPNGESAGSYDDLTMQVYDGNFSAVVGDTTILANRSDYVDFTMPYSESGVSMVVPIRDNRKKSAWVFLKPLTLDLWVMTACSFVFIGFVVWVLEHRVNKHFRGPPSHQIGTSFWFSFSTMVFAHRERVVSNLARFVVIIWVFVVLILTQSYTASLTSLLTVEQLRPTVTDVNELKKNKLNVGYQEGSFVLGMLQGLGFEDFQLKPYNSSEQMDELLTRGSANDGISAAFDEIPYIRILLGTYCSKYTMVDPTFKTDGLGFVFPRGSSLGADISRAILKVTEDPRMQVIQNAWFHNYSTCADPSTTVSSNSLDLDSFWGLFLIVGVASVSALIIFALTFLYEHKHIWLQDHPNTSIWRRIGILLRIFDQRDLSSHTFGKSGGPHKSEMSSPYHHSLGAVEDSPNSYCPQTPTSHTESNFSFYGDQGMPSEDNIEATSYGGASHDVEATIELPVVPAITTYPTRVTQLNS